MVVLNTCTCTLFPPGHQAGEIVYTVLQKVRKHSSAVQRRIHLPHVLVWVYAIWFREVIKNYQANSQIVLFGTLLS